MRKLNPDYISAVCALANQCPYFRLLSMEIRELTRGRALLEADVNYLVVKDFCKRITDRCVGQQVLDSLTPGQQVVKIVSEELTALMGAQNARLTWSSSVPTIYMLCGLQGAGKTTMAAKLANYLQKTGKRPLLAACDSCIGGKTSLNYKGFKNLLGTFYPPAEILICPLFFNTLTQDDFLSGLGEVVKFNFLMGSAGVESIEQHLNALLNRDPAVVNRFVESSLQYKKGYIEEDEFDNGVRVFLNFAHTFGHAIESASAYAIPHGTAVAMGMIAANRVSVQRGLLSEPSALRMERTLRRIIPRSALSHILDADQLTAAIRNDKKQIGTGITAILMDESAKLSLYHDLSPQEVRAAFLSLAGGM